MARRLLTLIESKWLLRSALHGQHRIHWRREMLDLFGANKGSQREWALDKQEHLLY